MPNTGQDDSIWGPEVVGSKEYAKMTSHYSTEKPLHEQLEPIAIVGIGCRLPGDISSPMEFWDLIMSQRDARSPVVPKDRFNIDAHLHPNNERPGSFNVPGGYFLNDSLKEFDPALFDISPAEAMWMDPQQKKLLEVVYESLESGGIPMSQIQNTKTGVFVGSFTTDFQQMAFKEPDFRHSYAATGVDPGIIANRISHVFNLTGPSSVVNTACSSSIYAMHNACNALRNNECVGAIVGGTNLILSVDQHMNTAKLGVLSPDSTCHTFDKSANGYGRAEAIVSVYLKCLKDAVRDGDPIRSVLRSSAVNSNGKVPGAGITHPSRKGQFEVIRHAYERGGLLDPRLTGYVECHGTGTSIGDPIEVHAVAEAMGKERLIAATDPNNRTLLIGAVKTNIGHSEAASGLSAIIKAALVLEKGVIPPTRGIKTLNPDINWDSWNVKVLVEPRPFPSHLSIHRVSVNSFGYGGTNGHFIVEGTTSLVPGYSHGQKVGNGVERAHSDKKPYFLPFSAHDKATLIRNIQAHGEVISAYDLVDVSYTLSTRRSRLSTRAFAVCNPESVTESFEYITDSFTFSNKQKAPVIGFVFTGQGAQWPRMGHDLMLYHAVFLKTIRKLDGILSTLPNAPDWRLEDALGDVDTAFRVHEAEFSQPLSSAVQIALVDLLHSWNVFPKVVIGHSSGEIAAAYAAGLSSIRQSIIAAYYRGLAVKDVDSSGAMMAVGLSAEAVEPYLCEFERQVTVACHNSPALVTLSGDKRAIESIRQDLEQKDIFAKVLKTGGVAYHSCHMDQAAATYREMMEKCEAFDDSTTRNGNRTFMISAVTNSLSEPSRPLGPSYWSKNLTSPVRFSQAVQTLASTVTMKDVNLLVEIGPHPALKGPIQQIFRERGVGHMDYLPTLERNGNTSGQILALAGQLFLRDYDLNYSRIADLDASSTSDGLGCHRRGEILVDLPPYQWNYTKKLWAESRLSVEHRWPNYLRHDTLGSLLSGGSRTTRSWRNRLRVIDLPWLRDHCLGADIIFPAAGYFSMAMEACRQLHEKDLITNDIIAYTLRDISIEAALVNPDDDDDGVETLLTAQPSVYNDSNSTTWWDFKVFSCSEDSHWSQHVAGSIGINHKSTRLPREVPRLNRRATGKAWNKALKTVGFDYGLSFQHLLEIRSDGKYRHASASTNIKQESGTVPGESPYVLHPGMMDSCLQLGITAIYAGRDQNMTCGFVPIHIGEISVWTPTPRQLENTNAQAYSWIKECGTRLFNCCSQLTGSDGRLVMSIDDMRCVAYEAAVPQNLESTGTSEHEQPFTQTVWKIDVDSLTANSPINGLSARDIAALIAFKNPGSRVLDMDGVDAAAVFQGASSIDSITSTTSPLAHGNFGNITTVLLDHEFTSDQQSLQQGQYDIVMPGNLRNAEALRWLLSPSGYIVASEGPYSSLGSTFTMQHLTNGCALLRLHQDETGDVLRGSVVRDATVENVAPSTVLVYQDELPEMARKIAALIGEMGSVRFAQLCDADFLEGEHVVMIADLERPLLMELQENELSALQTLTLKVSSITWVSAGGFMNGTCPEQALVAGFARSVRSEMASVDFTIVDLHPNLVASDFAAQEIRTILAHQMQCLKSRELEYCLDDGLVYISRIVPQEGLNERFRSQGYKPKRVPFQASDTLVGLPDTPRLTFAHGERVHENIKDSDVRVRVRLSHLTSEDVQIRKGSSYKTSFSHEICGEIVSVGVRVSHLKIGDHVFGMNCNGLATFQNVPASMLQKIVDTDVLEEMVTLPLACATALHGLETIARIEPGEIVLILHGTGFVGSVAALVSNHAKTRTYVAVASAEEADQVASLLGLPRTQVLSPCDSSVPVRLRELTGGRNADVVFSSSHVTATTAHSCWREIAPFGRYINVGTKSILIRGAIDPFPTSKGASYSSFDILDVLEHKPQLASNYLQQTTSLYRQGVFSGLGPIDKHNICDFDRTVSMFADDFTLPPVVIEYKESEGLIDVVERRDEPKLKAEATYLLVGCLGGIGRCLARWMSQRGARHLVFMSRSGMNSENTVAWAREMQEMGVTCHIVKGDVTKRQDVDDTLRAIPDSHPVAGVVHAAMVLSDSLFHNMSYRSWKQSTAPKVLGAMNLHQALSDVNLDFMIFTSSTSGVMGIPGQANYAAANSFLDCLARHRVSNGLRTTSLILPMINNIGVVAENPQIESALLRKGAYGINEDQLLKTFEAAVFGLMPAVAIDHVMVGFDPTKLRKSLSGNDVTDQFWTQDKRFGLIMRTVNEASLPSTEDGSSRMTVLEAIKAAKSLQEAIDFVIDHFTAKLARLLLLDMEIFDPVATPIRDYGLDSMIGAELRNWIYKQYAFDIAFQKLNSPSFTIEQFAASVCASKRQG